MPADSNNDEDSNSEPSVRWSPRFARQQRRKKSLAAAIIRIAMGTLVLVEGLHAISMGTWVTLGSVSRYVELPGWLAALVGLFIIFIGGLILWRNVVRRS